jgi:hypothetical protein
LDALSPDEVVKLDGIDADRQAAAAGVAAGVRNSRWAGDLSEADVSIDLDGDGSI